MVWIGTFAVLASLAGEAQSASSKKLGREELVALFSGLSNAAKTARTFQAAMKRLEQSGFVLDEDPVVFEGMVWIERPDCFRQQITKPRPSLTVASKEHLWIHFPAAREAQHVDLRKGVKGRADTTSESIMPWLTFDLPGLEKKYKIRAKKVTVPKGVGLRKVPARTEGDAGARADEVPTKTPEKCYRIEFVPRDPKLAPGLAALSIWVDGQNPWPLRIERETSDGDLQTTEFGAITLDAPVDVKLFRFRPPSGTKVVELSE
jgi:outer membrane lipoprotein-sorting protein